MLYTFSLFINSLYAVYILREAALEVEHGFKIEGKNINNLCNVDNTTLIVENASDLQAVKN